MRLFYILIIFISSSLVSAEQATYEETPYKEPKVMFEFYFDEPNKINSALYWLRSYINPLTEAPYNYAPEFMDIKVIIHGTEIVTLAKKNYQKYKTSVDRIKYYSLLGVEFRVCALAASDFGYKTSDFQSFVKVVPSAIIELGHWQQEGYAIIKPEILEKKFSVEELR